MIQYRDGIFRGIGGLNLYYQSWHPQGKTQGILIIVHGLGGHSGEFSNLVEEMIRRDYAVYGFDLRGHGKSPGQRAYINSWQEFREDLRRFIALIDRQEPPVPRFLFGHSLGSVIALEYVIHFPEGLKGVIVSALPLGKVGVSSLRITIGKILSLVCPRFTLSTGIDPSASSRNLEVVKAYAQDRLRHRKGTARLVTEFLRSANWIGTNAANLQLPLLMLHGGADRISPPQASQVFFEQVIFPDKQLYEYAESYHDLHDDLNYQEILTDLGQWLDSHLERIPTNSLLSAKDTDATSSVALYL